MSSVVSPSPEATRAWGAALARAISRLPADSVLVVALNGELGAGKTTLVGGLLAALGVKGTVRSPTYTLLETYELEHRTLYHLDLYRIADPRELEMLAVRDLLNAGSVLLVEWAEKGRNVLPKPDLTLVLRYSGHGEVPTDREIELQASSTAGKELAMSLQRLRDEVNVSL